MTEYVSHSETYPGNIPPSILRKIGEAGIEHTYSDTTASTLDTLTPSERAPFEHGLAHSTRLYERIGITPPPLELFEQSGVDFKGLSHAWPSMVQEGLRPKAVFAKADLSLEEASALYSHLRADETIPDNPLRKHVIPFMKNGRGKRIPGEFSYDGLAVNSGVAQHWHAVTGPVQSPDNTAGWTLRLVASSSEAPVKIGYGDSLQDGAHLITIPEYLTLQASLIQSGEPPIDKDEFVWLESNGTFTPEYIGHPRAPMGKWDSKEGVLFIGHDGVVGGINKTVHGARPAQS